MKIICESCIHKDEAYEREYKKFEAEINKLDLKIRQMNLILDEVYSNSRDPYLLDMIRDFRRDGEL